jgi:hypothetical protein
MIIDFHGVYKSFSILHLKQVLLQIRPSNLCHKKTSMYKIASNFPLQIISNVQKHVDNN